MLIAHKMIEPHTIAAHAGNESLAEDVGSNSADKVDRCPQLCTTNGLVGPLSSGKHAERCSEQRFSRTRKLLHRRHQIHVCTADDEDLLLAHRVLPALFEESS